MWLCTTIGFFSVVCGRTDGGRGREIDGYTVMVRARVRGHLEALKARFPTLGAPEIRSTTHTDYPYRVIVPKAAWADCVRELTLDIAYGNFKSAAAAGQGPGGNAYIHALHETWAVMRRMQNDRKNMA